MPVYAGLDAKATSDASELLRTAQIPFRIEPGSGALAVPQDQIGAAKLALAAAGLPANSTAGFETIQGDQGFGTSQDSAAQAVPSSSTDQAGTSSTTAASTTAASTTSTSTLPSTSTSDATTSTTVADTTTTTAPTTTVALPVGGFTLPRPASQVAGTLDVRPPSDIPSPELPEGSDDRGRWAFGAGTRHRGHRATRGDTRLDHVLVIDGVHGNEPIRPPAVRGLLDAGSGPIVEVWLVPVANPDGSVAGLRCNANGVDLNRNFDWE